MKTLEAKAVASPIGPVKMDRMLKMVWPDADARPSARWVWDQVKYHGFPCIRAGHLVWFDIDQVRAFLSQ